MSARATSGPRALARFAVPAVLAAFTLLPHPVMAESGPQFRDLESQAMGRSGVASSHGASALFLNPAALGRATGGDFGVSADMGVNGVLLDYAQWAKDNSQNLNNFDSLLAHIGPIDDKWAPFSNSMIVYGNWQGVGMAALLDTRYDLTVAKAVVTPVLGIGALSDVVLTAGRGFAVDDGYRFGVALKYMYRLRYDDRLVGPGDEDFYTAKHRLERKTSGIFGEIAKIQVAGDIAQTEQGAGLNLGAEKDIDKAWTAGLSLLDFPTVLDQSFVRPDVDLGLSWHPGVNWVPDLGNHLVVNLDWQHFLIPGTPWFKQLKLGAAYEGWMNGRQVAYIGMGLNDGYPTFGVRVGYIVYLSYVYTAEEIGTYPGQDKLSFHKLVLQAEY
ncbi:MAG: hypothetical protein JF616_10050 [Fibrobacteres bacterium]|nr:hypothetical protein [Fibrobacterota bacterium]